ncbi:MAG: hypothetical protein M3Q70_01595, partial [bacterium]|nr:hypothetical protein [bacterium]
MSARIYKFPGAEEPPVTHAEFHDYITDKRTRSLAVNKMGALIGSKKGFTINFEVMFQTDPSKYGIVTAVEVEDERNRLDVVTSENFPNVLINEFHEGRSRELLLSLAAGFVISYGIIRNLAEKKGA